MQEDEINPIFPGMTSTVRQPALFLGHGSPMTVITDNPARAAFIKLGERLPRPSAILCVTAHWETTGTTHLTAGPHPRTIHDFGGFPQALFDMRYPAPGSAALIDQVIALAGQQSVEPDDTWGFDHGVWSVTQPMFPACDIPTVGMSLNRSLDAEQHIALAAKLAPLRDEGVLIIGSGNIVHNLAQWRATAGTQPEWAVEFQGRINTAVLERDISALISFAADDRAAALAINSAEHYLPLLYATGASLPDDDIAIFSDTLDGSLSMTSILFGDAGLAEAIP